MMSRRCVAPLATATLLEYWLGELDELGEARVDEHLLGCDECAATLRDLVDLAAGVRTLVRHGLLPGVVTDEFVEHLAAEGLRLREYRVACNGSVHCTVAPDDDLVVARLEAPLADVEQLDLVMSDAEGQDAQRLRDIPFAPGAAYVVVTSDTERLRALPRSTERMRLLAVESGRERVIGNYTFVHTPWAER